MFLSDLRIGIRFVVIAGILAHLLGISISKKCFDHSAFPFSDFEWERGGRFYNKLGVSRWMAKMPDMSKIIPYMFQKKLDANMRPEYVLKYINETCLAELIHWLLVFSSPVLFFIVGGACGVLFMFMYIIGNIPFIIIQRYNRPKLVRLYKRQSKRVAMEDEEETADEGVDTLV
ncbi:MAG: hypothetical protein IJ303_03300 [Clostridia bacterium]|nr:hypothetical protein [Clostridia bacterium]